MKVHPNKRAIRALGVAESFRKGDGSSVLAGVVMRSDRIVDGFSFGRATVGGDDATHALVRMYKVLARDDVNVIMLSGCIISHYNIVDVDMVAKKTGRPVICLTYRESAGIERSIRAHFIEAEVKIGRYRMLGERVRMVLGTGQAVYAWLAGISEPQARLVVESFTVQGGVPEPVRVAKALAHALRSSGQAVA